MLNPSIYGIYIYIYLVGLLLHHTGKKVRKPTNFSHFLRVEPWRWKTLRILHVMGGKFSAATWDLRPQNLSWFLGVRRWGVRSLRESKLGGWTNPFERYARQNGWTTSPIVRGKNSKNNLSRHHRNQNLLVKSGIVWSLDVFCRTIRHRCGNRNMRPKGSIM